MRIKNTNNLKVLYDHQSYGVKVGGISRYFAELLKYNPTADFSLRYSDNIYVKEEYFKKFNIAPKDNELRDLLLKSNFKGDRELLTWYYKSGGYVPTNFTAAIDRIKNSDFDVFHPTYYGPYFLQFLNNKPFVLTIYDMIHEIFPQLFNDGTHIKKKLLALQADCIIAISQSTKNDILRFYPEINDDKIKVIHLASSFPSIDYCEEKENYILYTGGRGVYKNFKVFAEAVAPLLEKYDINIVCTSNPFSENEVSFLKKIKIYDRVINKLFVSEEELAQLHAKALAFVFPSLYEGFGMPVLESFATGSPTILSNTSSLPEVGGDAAIYFDPKSKDDIRSQIEKVITSSTLQKELALKGKERLKLFSWEKCAAETMLVYKKVCR